jgi:hypothetical protein
MISWNQALGDSIPMSQIALTLFVTGMVVVGWALGPSYFALMAGFSVAFSFFALAVSLVFRTDKIEVQKSRARASTVSDVMQGQARTSDDWMPDARVQGGMKFNRKKHRIEISGRLSDDSLERAFR